MGVAALAGDAVRGLLRPRAGEFGFDYEIRRSERARNIRITVSERGVVVVLPRRGTEREAHAFVYERRAWIDRALLKLAAEAQAVAARGLADGDTVPYLDDDLTLRLIDGDSQRVGWARAAGELRVHTADHSRERIAELLERWYRWRAREEVATRLEAVTARNRTRYARVAIRDQRTRWGSCSSSGTLSFNWRLLLAPEHVLGYVVEHEAAHIEVRDHSPRFWALLDDRVPDWRASRDWLRRHGGTLRLV
ncbi:MAG: M48 family metallopeptidase [Thermoleophilia bacterium]|nr:M48 family metallopeptidase [Thermoleophilia bacterium]